MANFKKNPEMIGYRAIRKGVLKAKAAGLDVSKYEEQLPEIKNKGLIGQIDNYIKSFNKYTNICEYRIIIKGISNAKEAGLDVSKYEEKLPEIENKLLIAEIKNGIEGLNEDLDRYEYQIIIERISIAKEAGLDVSKYEEKLSKMKNELLIAEIENDIEGLNEYSSRNKYWDVMENIIKAKEAGFDVSKYEEQLPEVGETDVKLNILKKIPFDKSGVFFIVYIGH